MDETPFWLDVIPKTTVEVRGVKKVVALESCDGGSRFRRVTCFPIVSAAGEKVLLGIIMNSNTDSKEPQVVHNNICIWKQKSACMTSPILRDTLRKVFSPLLQSSERKLLILDSSSTHITQAVRQVCHEANFDLLVIPAGHTGKLQPLDLTFNRSFKSHSRKNWIRSQFTRKTYKGNLAESCRQSFVTMAKEAWEQVPTKTVINGFKLMMKEL